jgi:short-subunit dehydrogenase
MNRRLSTGKTDFVGKVVVVTGSNRGIGYHIASVFLHHGAQVVLNGRDSERLAKAQESLDPEGVRTLAVSGDVTDPQDVSRLVSQAVERFGGIDVLVCNAGMMMRGRFDELTPPVVDRLIRTNIVGVSLPVIEALPEIKKRKGSVEIISSLAGIRGMPHISLYCASKMALTAIAQSLWVELDGTGVHVGILYVGITENDPDKRLTAADGSRIQIESARPFQSTQNSVARMAFKQVARRRRKIILTFPGKALVAVHWLMPRVLTFLMAKMQKIAARFAK